MRSCAAFILAIPLVMYLGCSKTVLVDVPPRMDLSADQTYGIVQFSSNNSDAKIDAYVTRHFQERIQAAQPGTRFVELGRREAVLSAVGADQFDADAIKRIGQKYGIDALFVGELVYAEPRTEIKVQDIADLEGSMRTEVRGDIASKLFETRTGASVWSSSAWAKRQTSRVKVSAEQGVSASSSRNANPREEMVPALIFHLTEDFRPSTEKRPVK